MALLGEKNMKTCPNCGTTMKTTTTLYGNTINICPKCLRTERER